jgi:hypothetical protein
MSVKELGLVLSTITKLLPYIIPLAIIEYGLMIFALIQCIKSEVAYLPKWGGL